MIVMIEELERFRGKRVILVFDDGEEVLCKPIQRLDEEPAPYQLEVLEDSESFKKGDPLVVWEEEIASIRAA